MKFLFSFNSVLTLLRPDGIVLTSAVPTVVGVENGLPLVECVIVCA